MRREKLSHDELISLLMYDKDTGIFRRRIGVRGAKSLSVAGFVNSRGYVEISVRGSKYYAHRLAWLYIHGIARKESGKQRLWLMAKQLSLVTIATQKMRQMLRQMEDPDCMVDLQKAK